MVKCNFKTKWMNHISDDNCEVLPDNYCLLKGDKNPMLCDGDKCIFVKILANAEMKT